MDSDCRNVDTSSTRGRGEMAPDTTESKLMKPSIRSHDLQEDNSPTGEILELCPEKGPLVKSPQVGKTGPHQQETNGSSQDYRDVPKTGVPSERKRLIDHYNEVIDERDSEIKRLCTENKRLLEKNEELRVHLESVESRNKLLREQLNREVDTKPVEAAASDDPTLAMREGFARRS